MATTKTDKPRVYSWDCGAVDMKEVAGYKTIETWDENAEYCTVKVVFYLKNGTMITTEPDIYHSNKINDFTEDLFWCFTHNRN